MIQLRSNPFLFLATLGLLSLLDTAFAQTGDWVQNLPNGNRALFLSEDQAVGFARWDFIQNENKSISSVYYMMDGNKVGASALAGYREAAKRGALVRLIMDGYTPASWIDTQFDPGVLKAAILDGVQIKMFNPVNLSNVFTNAKLLTYKRTHDKMSVFGGQKTVDLGDRNFQNVNFRLLTKGKNSSTGIKSYRSIETFVQGEVVNEAQAYFDEMWKSKKVAELDLSQVTDAQVEQGRKNLDRYLKVMNEATAAGKHQPQNWFEKMKPVKEVHFFHDSIEGKGRITGGELVIADFIASAQHSLKIISPYIVLTPVFEKALEKAIQNGVKDIEVFTAAPFATDVPFSSLAFERQAMKLKKWGVKVYQHQGPELMHAKGLVVDGTKAAIMTHNLDAVSEYVNLESGLIFDDETMAKQLIAFTDEIKKESKLLEKPSTWNLIKVMIACGMILGGKLWPTLPASIR